LVGLFPWFRWSEGLPPGAYAPGIPPGSPRKRAMQLGKKPERERDPTQARSPRPPRSMAAEAARRQPRPRWTMAGPRHTGQLTRQRSAAAPSSPQAAQHRQQHSRTTTAAETATQPRTACTEGSRPHGIRTAHSARQEGSRSRPRCTADLPTTTDHRHPGRRQRRPTTIYTRHRRQPARTPDSGTRWTNG